MAQNKEDQKMNSIIWMQYQEDIKNYPTHFSMPYKPGQ